jgi:hypothetical protein
MAALQSLFCKREEKVEILGVDSDLFFWGDEHHQWFAFSGTKGQRNHK